MCKCKPGFTIGVQEGSCTACPAGSFKQDSGHNPCNLCQQGTYSSASGSTSCGPCGDGFISPEGSSTKSACQTELTSGPRVEFQVMLPYSRETFTDVLQGKFKIGIAAVSRAGCECGITEREVNITRCYVYHLQDWHILVILGGIRLLRVPCLKCVQCECLRCLKWHTSVRCLLWWQILAC